MGLGWGGAGGGDGSGGDWGGILGIIIFLLCGLVDMSRDQREEWNIMRIRLLCLVGVFDVVTSITIMGFPNWDEETVHCYERRGRIILHMRGRIQM